MSFEMVVKDSLVEKMRYLCRRYPNEEWSGLLFYSSSPVKGGFRLVAEDLFLMDIGSGVYTEYEMDKESMPDATLYMVEHGLTGMHIGHVHSHNKMSVFFSETDKDTLEKTALDMQPFLSLIVNNAMDMTAMIAWKKEVTRNNSFASICSLFGMEMKEEDRQDNTVVEEVETCPVRISLESIPKDEELETRCKELEKKKKEDEEKERKKWRTLIPAYQGSLFEEPAKRYPSKEPFDGNYVNDPEDYDEEVRTAASEILSFGEPGICSGEDMVLYAREFQSNFMDLMGGDYGELEDFVGDYASYLDYDKRLELASLLRSMPHSHALDEAIKIISL